MRWKAYLSRNYVRCFIRKNVVERAHFKIYDLFKTDYETGLFSSESESIGGEITVDLSCPDRSPGN